MTATQRATIDEHIRRQDAGELPEGYPIHVRKIDGCPIAGFSRHVVSTEHVTKWCDHSRDAPSSRDLDIDSEERCVIETYRNAIEAINTYRKKRGETEL